MDFDRALKHIALIAAIAYLGGNVVLHYYVLTAPSGAAVISPLSFNEEYVINDLVKANILTVANLENGAQALKLTFPTSTVAGMFVDFIAVVLGIKRRNDT